MNAYSSTKGLEDAERKYLEIIESERHQFRKRDQGSKEIIAELTRRLKVIFMHT